MSDVPQTTLGPYRFCKVHGPEKALTFPPIQVLWLLQNGTIPLFQRDGIDDAGALGWRYAEEELVISGWVENKIECCRKVAALLNPFTDVGCLCNIGPSFSGLSAR